MLADAVLLLVKQWLDANPNEGKQLFALMQIFERN